MMVPGHQFPAYLTLTKSCIYARNHTVKPPPYLENNQQKTMVPPKSHKKALNHYSFKKEFGKEKATSKNKDSQKLQKPPNQYFLNGNLKRKKQLRYNIQLQMYRYCGGAPTSVSCIPHTHQFMHICTKSYS